MGERMCHVAVRRGLATIVCTAVAAGGASAQLPPGARSAPISDVRYEITVDSAAVGDRHIGVAMSFAVRDTATVLLALPAWSPGHYVLLWFARRVSRFAAEEDGVSLEWGKADHQTWRISPRGPGRVRVTFSYLADTNDRAVAWTQPDFAFFLGTNLFLYPVGRGFDWPATVTVRTEGGWRIATGMADGAEPGSFRASNYHDLADMPFFVGRFDLDSALVADRWFRLAWWPEGSLTAARRDRTVEWLRRIVPQEVAVFGDTPFRNYTIFMVSDTFVDGGGLEHQSGQMDEVGRNQLDSPFLAGLYAHELFHAWNVKRLQPADLVPYRYDDIQPTRWLWVSEGVTDYYGGLAQVRGGVTDSSEFFAAMAGAVTSVLSAPPTALGDASLSAWVGPTDGSGGLYYPKGALAGFLLDVMIRDASDGRHSLDDVMRELYRTTYERGRGFTPQDWWSAVALAAGLPVGVFREFARRCVDGREPLPFDSVLALAGLRMSVDSVREPRLGIATAVDSGQARVTFVSPDGAAAAAGIRVGDRLVSLGGVSVSDDASFAAFRARYAGTAETSLPAVVSRSGEVRRISVPVQLFTRIEVRIVAAPGAPAKAVRIRHGLLAGSPGR